MKRIFSSKYGQVCKKALLGLGLLASPLSAMEGAASIEREFSPLAVQEQLIKAGNGLGLETLVVSPTAESAEPLGVLVMTHGFLLSQTYYRDILAQIADQGFVVLAPQAYTPGGLPFGKPTTDVEAQKVAQAIGWFSTQLEGIVDRPVDFSKLGIVSHSRGSKVAWTIMRDKLLNVQALAAIDPVDGTQDGTSRVTGGSLTLNVPAYIIGSGLGGNGGGLSPACAPSDLSFNQFWKSAQTSPSWLLVAKDYGHMDFLDEASKCGFICSVCSKAPTSKSRPDFRAWIARGVGSFMRGILYEDQTSLDTLDQASTLINASIEKR